MDLWFETSIVEALAAAGDATQPVLKASVRVTNRGDQEAAVNLSDFRFLLMGSDNAELETLAPASAAPSEAAIAPGEAETLTVPFRITTKVEPNTTYNLYWEWGKEKGKVGFEFL